MNSQDLRTLAEVGRALWIDPRQSQIATIETLSAVALLDLTPDSAIERAAAALLERVTQRGIAANNQVNIAAMKVPGFPAPFLRLYPEERFLLVALHLGRWSYSRMARIFELSTEQIEAMAWNARLTLAATDASVGYPSGAPSQGMNCPEYDARRPWTQRFLDEEIQSGRERLFLQNHLMACDSCRQTLARCREVYYRIEKLLPRLNAEAGDEQVLRNLEAISRRGLGLRSPVERTFWETLPIFFTRKDVRWVGLAVVALLVWRVLG